MKRIAEIADFYCHRFYCRLLKSEQKTILIIILKLNNIPVFCPIKAIEGELLFESE